MKSLVMLAALLQVSTSSYVSVKMPYASPAGVTYINGYQGHEYPVGYAAQTYAAPAALQYQYPAYRYPAAVAGKVEAHHVGYAAAQVPAVAAVPYVKHVPTVSHVPVTRYEAHPAVIEKQLDVVKPAVSTRKFEVRRPAIQKQFYDIEERVIVRPAGSAVVELDEPTSKLQRGPAVVQPLDVSHYSAVSPVTHNLVAQAASFAHAPSSPTTIPFVAHAPVHVTVAPVISHAPVSHYQPSSTAAPASADGSQGESQSEDDQSVTVENADFRGAQFRQGLFRAAGEGEKAATRGQERMQQEYFQSLTKSQVNSIASQSQTSDIQVKSNGEQSAPPRFLAHDPTPSPSVIPSLRGSPEENRSNQQKLIDLLTARGGVADVGFSRDGLSSSVGDAGHVRARVISATPAPEYAEPTGERVSTRRVVVSRPIETLQEVDVLEPATKYERISVQHPTLIKTARLDHIQVHGSVPVVGKALTPAVAHAAVPVYQKTFSPAYAY
ncbi:uncharacterized protein LOC107045021 [Diachasma alloeum]|uniref:uncharacterized protein LOC107045021 n=1 Tax=Diachasma alloeum TaxID=454923 RepID=UPI0007384C6E|nr:uncharacterized protein LOC107045021 [Diachasma alloeum]